MLRSTLALLLTFAVALSAVPGNAQTSADGTPRTVSTGQITLKELLYSARRGDILAQRLVGDRYDRGNGLARDPVKAAKWYIKAAQRGDSVSQRNLGYLNETGDLGEKNYVEAEKWYRKAAEQGDVEAQRSLVFIYEAGLAGDVDLAAAAKWSDRANGRSTAGPTKEISQLEKQILAGVQSNENGKTASGQSVAKSVLGLSDDGGSAPMDIGLSYNRHLPAATEGDVHAQYRLGLVYLKGQGVRRDPRRARTWLHKSAEAGYAGAQAALGAMYAKGIGAERNIVQAYFWLKLAALRLPPGSAKKFAMSYRNRADRTMTADQRSKVQQLARDFDTDVVPATTR